MFNRSVGWARIALAASLLLNLLLVGIVSGRWAASLDPAWMTAGRTPTFQARLRALPPGERATFDAALEPHREAVIQARQSLRAARLTAFGALAAPIYDRAVMQQDFSALVTASDAAQRAIDAALIDGFATLSPATRATLAGVERWQGN